MLQLTWEGAEGQPRRPVPLATALWALAVCDTQQLQHANYPPEDKTPEVNILIIVKKAKVKGNLPKRRREEQPLLQQRLWDICAKGH